ncbi:hypothetical protein GQ42DRAFT_156522 [Ramicandelaber brevisporus]|nr:hypothetical protein GQ42DRAFT_156522 [Ramicandelaber brevisporus]
MSVTPSSTGAAASHYHPYARSTVSAVTNNGSGVNYSGNSTPTSSIARMSINHNQQRHQQYAPPQPPPPPPHYTSSSSSSSNVSESVVRHESSPSHHHQYAGQQQQYPQPRGYSTAAVSGGGGSNLAVSYIPRVIPHPMSASSVPLASLPPLNGHPMHPHPQPAQAPLQSTGGHSVNGPVVTMHGHANTESTGSGYLPTAGTLSPGSPPSKEDLPPMPMQLPPYDPAFVNSVDAAIVAQRNLHYRTATTPPASRTSPLGLGNANIVDDGSDYGDNGSEIGSIKTASDTSVLMQHVQVGRPSKRAGGPTLTSEQRRERRLIRNREAARVCRKKRKDHTERLEDENKTLRDQILNLRSTIATMQAECKCESATRGHQHQHQHHQHQHQNLDDQYLEPQQPQQYSAVPSPPLAQMGPMEQPLPMRHQHQLSQPTPQYAFTTPVKPFAPAGTLMTTPSSAALANSAAVGYAPVSPVSPDN